jgi:tetratricopeptide (TPR) repeat protein
MATNLPGPKETRAHYWRRVLRPLYWWLLLVLVLYGIRLHQRLSAQTNLQFSAAVPGQPFFPETTAELDGKPFSSGQQVRIGWHQLVLRHPKGNLLTTNLFIWYGERNLGKISLERSKGTLAISATPVARQLVIRGPEFTATLTNRGEFTTLVPTDHYVVEATYPYWQSSTAIEVSKDVTATYRFAPRFGSLTIEGSHPDISFMLRKPDETLIETGHLPATIVGLPEASGYQLRALRKEDSQDIVIGVTAGLTNALKIEFVYGVVTIESEPTGATVLKDGNVLGITPITLPEVNPGTFKFLLKMDEYEPANGELAVLANQTNTFYAGLISRHFTRAMADARQFYASASYNFAMQAATEALKFKSGDSEATNLLHDATIMDHVVKAQSWAARGEFTNAITEANLALALAPDNIHTKELVTDYSNREQQRLDTIHKREAELAEQARQRRARELAEQQAQQRMKEFSEAFGAANRPYENAFQFSPHQLNTTNSVSYVGDGISSALSRSQPAFENVRLHWIYPHLFMLEARQRLGIGYRDCLVLGSQIRDNEVFIRFKVFEYEHPPQVKLLGGLLSVSTEIKTTSQDPQVVAANAKKFQQRTENGVSLVTSIIQGAIGQ